MSKKFSEIVQYWMERRGLKQSALAKRAGFGPGRISEYLSDKADPSYENLQRLASALEVTLSEFFGMDEGRPAQVAPPEPGPDFRARYYAALEQIAAQAAELSAQRAEIDRLRGAGYVPAAPLPAGAKGPSIAVEG